MKALVLIFVLFFVLFQVQTKTVKHFVNWGHYNSDTQPDSFHPDWMKKISDDKIVSKISIPGTHSSGSYPAKGGQANQCQSWNIYAQLQAGIRFLDIKIGFEDKNIAVFHDSHKQIELSKAFGQINDFLRQKPHEFVIMLVSHEYGNSSIEQNQNLLKQKIREMDLPVYYSKDIPTLGKVRGKVWVIVKTGDFPSDLNTFSIKLDKVDYDKKPNYILQNNWDAQLSTKIDLIKRVLFNSCSKKKMKFNFMNKEFINVFGNFPYSFAKKDGGTNQSIQSILNKSFKGCTGILIMDFPGTNLIDLIINNNYSDDD